MTDLWRTYCSLPDKMASFEEGEEINIVISFDIARVSHLHSPPQPFRTSGIRMESCISIVVDGAPEVKLTPKADCVNVQGDPQADRRHREFASWRNTIRLDSFDWCPLGRITFARSRKAAAFISSLVIARNAVKKMLYRYGPRSAQAWWKHQSMRDVSYKVQRHEHGWVADGYVHST